MRGGVVPPGESERSKKKKFDPFEQRKQQELLPVFSLLLGLGLGQPAAGGWASLKIFGGGDERVNLIPKKPTLTKRRLALVSIFPLE